MWRRWVWWVSLSACAPFSPSGARSAGDPEAYASGEVCVDRELPSGGSCEHSYGGQYADGACSAGFQCCDGAWGSRGACGECACVETSGELGCAPEPVGASCEHTNGGVYGDQACSAGWQCCDGLWSGRGTCGECACVEPSGTQGCGEVDRVCTPAFEGGSGPLPADLRAQMVGASWEPGCPVGLDQLSLVTARHWGFDRQIHTGRLVVRASAAPVVLDALRAAWESGYPIERMEPISAFGGSDDASMAANNTSAFNCRRVTGGTAWSQHSYGDAIDINPLVNPYVSGSTVLPPGGADYLDRNPSDPGVLTSASPLVQAFLARGWTWGGTWSSRKDYQHFSANGR